MASTRLQLLLLLQLQLFLPSCPASVTVCSERTVDGECVPSCQNNSTCTCPQGCGQGRCTAPNTCTCEEGWTGHTCSTPVCAPGCHQTHGSCDVPGECRCDVGWWGETCELCFPYPGCEHGTCSEPWECTCKPGWTGLLCDTRSDMGAEENGNDERRAESRLGQEEAVKSSEVEVGQGEAGERDQCARGRNPCLNGGTCRNSSCICPPLFTGRHCDYLAPRSSLLTRRPQRKLGEGERGREEGRRGGRRGQEERRAGTRREESAGGGRELKQGPRVRQGEERRGKSKERKVLRRPIERIAGGRQEEGNVGGRQEEGREPQEEEREELKVGERRQVRKKIKLAPEEESGTGGRIIEETKENERNERREKEKVDDKLQEEEDWKAERRRLLQKHARIIFRQPTLVGTGQNGSDSRGGRPLTLVERQLLPLPVVFPRPATNLPPNGLNGQGQVVFGPEILGLNGQEVEAGGEQDGEAISPTQDSPTSNLIRRHHNQQDSTRPRFIQVLNSHHRPILVSAHAQALPDHHPLLAHKPDSDQPTTTTPRPPADTPTTTTTTPLPSLAQRNGSVSVQTSSSKVIHSQKLAISSTTPFTPSHKPPQPAQIPTVANPSTPTPHQSMTQRSGSNSTPFSPIHRNTPSPRLIQNTTPTPPPSQSSSPTPARKSHSLFSSRSSSSSALSSNPFHRLRPQIQQPPLLASHRSFPPPQQVPSPPTVSHGNTNGQNGAPDASSIPFPPTSIHRNSPVPQQPFPTPARPTPNPRPVIPSAATPATPTPTPTPTPILWSRVDRTVWPLVIDDGEERRGVRVEGRTLRPRIIIGEQFERFSVGAGGRVIEPRRQNWQGSYFNLGSRVDTGELRVPQGSRIVRRGEGGRVEIGGQGEGGRVEIETQGSAWQGSFSNDRGQEDLVEFASPSGRVQVVQGARGEAREAVVEGRELTGRFPGQVRRIDQDFVAEPRTRIDAADRYDVGGIGRIGVLDGYVVEELGRGEAGTQVDRFEVEGLGRGEAGTQVDGYDPKVDEGSYYKENEGGRVHIGDISRVDDEAPHREIFDAFIELKKV